MEWRRPQDIPIEIVRQIREAEAPHVMIVANQALLAGPDAGGQLDIECYPATPEGVCSAIDRARGVAADAGDREVIILAIGLTGGRLQQAVQAAGAAGGLIVIRSVATAEASSSCPPCGGELASMEHYAWGCRALARASRVAPLGRPWIRSARQVAFTQLLMGDFRPVSGARTTEAPLWRLTWDPRADDQGLLCVAHSGNLDDEIVPVLQGAEHAASVHGTCLAWHTRHVRRGGNRDPAHGRGLPIAVHTIGFQGPGILQRDLLAEVRCALERIADSARSAASHSGHVSGPAPAMCVVWRTSELEQAVHIPLRATDVHEALESMSATAALAGGRAVPTPTGVAILDLPAALAAAVVPRFEERNLHHARRVVATRTGRPGERDLRLNEPSMGSDLAWLVRTHGQMYPEDVAEAIRRVLGEMPTAHDVQALHPDTNEYEAMVQVGVPAHLGRTFRLGIAAEGLLVVGGNRCEVFEFTSTMPAHSRRTPGPSRQARVFHETVTQEGCYGGQLTCNRLYIHSNHLQHL